MRNIHEESAPLPTGTASALTVGKSARIPGSSYRIWARVSAPTNADDSFWVRMGVGNGPSPAPPPPAFGAWIKWNAMVLGAAYHWVQVKPDGATNPSTFNLTADFDNELQVAYREDGTKLDAFFITNNTAFNPNAAISGPPAPPYMQPAASGGNAAKLSWSAVAGATSYTIERRSSGCSFDQTTQCCEPDAPYEVIASGLLVHKFTDPGGSGQYRVTAVGPTGSSVHPPSVGPDNCYPFDPSQGYADGGSFYLRTQIPVLVVTAPMAFTSGGGLGAPAGTNSTAAPPAHGRARMDFELAAPETMRMWAEIISPSTSQDSFWVRWDDGASINWNSLSGYCHTLHDSSKTGSPVVRTLLGAGSHRIEWAYREGGSTLADNIILIADSPDQGEQCSD